MKKILSVLLAALIFATSMLPCAAATGVFAPSVQKKEDPGIVPHNVPEFGYCGADLMDSKEDEDLVHTPLDWLVVTPYGKKDTAPNDTIKDALEGAYTDISDLENIGYLDEKLDKIAGGLRPGADSGDLVAYELFNVSFINEHGDYFEKSGKQYVRITFATDVKDEATKPIIIYTPVGGDEWSVVDSENVVLNPDGTITVYFENVGTIVFLRLFSESTDTGISRDFYIWLAVLAVSATALVVVVKTGKKKPEETV